VIEEKEENDIEENLRNSEEIALDLENFDKVSAEILNDEKSEKS